MAKMAENNIDPWGRSLGETLRRWWWVPALLALVGGIIGGAAGVTSPKSAEALLRVQSTSDNPDALSRATQSAMSELGTQEVYAQAAKARGTDAATLRSGTEIAVVANSMLLSVTSTADTAANAAADANAIAQAGVTVSASRLQSDLTALTRSTETLIGSSQLRDVQAEQQRVIRLGGQLADSQGTLLTQSRQLSLLQPADSTQVRSASPVLLAGMGLIGGATLGVALTLLFGGRRGRMNSMREMRRLYPDIEFIPARDVPAIMSMEAGSADRIVLSGVRVPAGAVRGLVDPVTAGVHAAGRAAHVTEDVAQFGVPHDGPDGDRSVTVLQTPLSGTIVKRVARDPHSVLMVLVRPHKTRFEWLDEHATQFGDRTYVVVDG